MSFSDFIGSVLGITWCKYTECFQYGCLPTTVFVVYRNNFCSKDVKCCSRSENKTLDDTQ